MTECSSCGKQSKTLYPVDCDCCKEKALNAGLYIEESNDHEDHGFGTAEICKDCLDDETAFAVCASCGGSDG